jgi:hypothetical protein
MRTITSGTVRPACSYGFTVCIFAIEIWLAAFIIVEVTAAFKGDGFFTFASRLRMRTLAAFATASLA